MKTILFEKVLYECSWDKASSLSTVSVSLCECVCVSRVGRMLVVE